MSDEQEPLPKPENMDGMHITSTENYPKIVVMHGGEDEFKKRLWEVYVPLYIKMHEIYTSEQIFAMAYKSLTDFENYVVELKTHVNINFEDDLRKYGGEEAVKELRKLDEQKLTKRKFR